MVTDRRWYTGQMKRALILHGTNGRPNDHWLPWLRANLEAGGYEVVAPQLPACHTPDKRVYNDFIRNLGIDFSDSLLIGHSSGATAALNLLSEDWFPKVRTTALVGLFLNEKLTKSVDWYQAGQFDGLFPESGFDPELLKRKSGQFVCVHGDDDPYCDYGDAQRFAASVGAQLITIKGGKHLSSSSGGITELPQLTDVLRSHGLL